MLKFRHTLAWDDVDYARVAYYPRYSVWVDQGFHRHLHEKGFDVRAFIAQGYGLPYINVSCRYMRELSIDDTVEIEARIVKSDAKGFTVGFRITKVGDGVPAAEGELVRRCITTNPPKSAEMPQPLRAIIEELAK